MSKFQFYFTNNESTEVDAESVRFTEEGYVEALNDQGAALLVVPRERLNYLKKVS